MHKKGIYEKYIKRPQDFILSLLGIILSSPILLIVAILVRIKLGAPVLFKQERPGQIARESGKEKIFTLYKFRTMSDKKDKEGNLRPDEARLNRFGKALRASSLDELPELFNILKGDMALVGPRPLLVVYLDRYDEHQRRRHEVRPGLTGLAQVMGRNAISWEEKFDYDVKYVESITFVEDWKILLKTVVGVFKREGITSSTSVTMEEFMGKEK